jgi:hypothetical protein
VWGFSRATSYQHVKPKLPLEKCFNTMIKTSVDTFSGTIIQMIAQMLFAGNYNIDKEESNRGSNTSTE